MRAGGVKGGSIARSGGRYLPQLVFALVPALCACAFAGEVPVAMVEHVHPSGVFSFRVPASWRVEPLEGRKDAVQAQGDDVAVWFLRRAGRNGYDAQHMICMNERLSGNAAASLVLSYDYDSREGPFAGRMALDSAFIVSYGSPVRGQAFWRQRNVTLLGAGETVCIIAFCPAPTWKSSKQTRRTLESVVASVVFRAQP